MHSRIKKAAVLLWLSGITFTLGGCGESSLQGLETDLAMVMEKVGPSVVCIMAKNESSGEVKFGSGVVLDDGYILTTENILNNVNNITLKLQDGRVINDRQIVEMFCDFETNVSLIQVDQKELKPLKTMETGEIDKGCMGIALGNTNYSKGLDVNLGTVTKSWIGGADAYDEHLLIWHGPPVPYHGGTPIFNRKGELLGLTEGRPEGEDGVVFILPAKTCMRVCEVLKKDGKVKRGWIGIFCERKSSKCEEGEASQGVLINKVVEGSPAHRAGLSSGDRVIGFNGKPIENSAQLRRLISATQVGSHILLSVIRSPDNRRSNLVVRTVEHSQLGMRRCPHRSI
ncbi:MAG: PDZ domain-containing protein [candidate division Zixibacteria bacterium]|nr:PDZ domain-containing protein [candidate division Zixibacteria bacterium]